jgi:uncharacterized protein (TIGR00730 family)
LAREASILAAEHLRSSAMNRRLANSQQRLCVVEERLDAPAHRMSHRLMAKLEAICVYCGSGPGRDPAFAAAARNFGRILAENKMRLVYGGGSVGLMGALATAVLDHGGVVTGIIPEFLTARELALTRAQELIVTRDLHERKRLMFERCDAFVALPGGIGTLEELVEQLTWAQLGRHKKPILLANIEQFWDPLCALLDHMRDLDFIRAGLTVSPLVADRVEDILPKLNDSLRAVSEADKAMQAAEVERL